MIVLSVSSQLQLRRLHSSFAFNVVKAQFSVYSTNALKSTSLKSHYLVHLNNKSFSTSSGNFNLRKWNLTDKLKTASASNFRYIHCSRVVQGEVENQVKDNDISKEEPLKIMKVLNVAEKNDAAKRIANLLANGAVQTRNGRSVYNKLYEFQFNFRNQPTQMTMTSVSGHLLNYEFDQNYRKWYSCDPLELFDAPLAKQCHEKMKDIKLTLEQQAPYAQILIIWTDCDREGENIGFEVINVCKTVNPRLQVYRAKFSEITKEAVFRAMNNLIQPDKRVSDAVDVRQELDLRIGASFTRFQTLRLTKKFPMALADRLISYGSCQFPTLGFVVERYKSINEFIPEDFWKIDVTHTKDKQDVHFHWARVHLFNKLAVQTIYEMCLDSPIAKVVRVQNKAKSKWRPVALDTIEFEKLASRKLRIPAKQAMQIAEQLYTSGLISYPRTETNIFPPGIDLGALVQQQTESAKWGDFATRVLQQENGPTPRNGRKTDQAHPPIHPTKFDTCQNLSGNHQKIYELIVRHFLACCSKDAKGHEVIVQIDIAGEKFVASGLTVLERNYLEVYIYDKWSDKELPEFTEGETFHPTSIEMNEGGTQPPNLLTEADLIALMEKHGIGTDATHAEHIETIKTREYVGLQGNYFIPGKLGMGLVEGYDAMGFEMSKPRLRSQLEKDLQNICEGRRRPQDVLQEQIRKYRDVFIEAREKVNRLDQALARLLNDNYGAGAGAGGAAPPRGGGGGGNNGGNNRGGRDDDDDDEGGGGGGGSGGRGRGYGGMGSGPSSSRGGRGGVTRNVTQQNRPPAAPRRNEPPTPEERECSCGSFCDIRTTKKEGPNLGRQFYKCDNCGFFEWITEASSASAPSQQSFTSNSYGFGTQSSSSTNSSMGPPPPRQQASGARQNYQRSQPSTQSQARVNNENESGVPQVPNCSCESPAGIYTVRKDGPNKGRKFFGCCVPYGSQEPRCDFFQWDVDGIADAIANANRERSSTPTNHQTPQSTSRSREKGGQTGVKRARRCGICHQTGHTRRNCPDLFNDEDEEMDYS